MCALFYSKASWVYVVSWLPDTETYKYFNAKHAFLASPGKAVEGKSYDMHAQDLCSKKHPLRTGKRIEMTRSFENFGLASEWDVMRRVCFITTVFIVLHWPMSQHAMRSSADDGVTTERSKSSGRDRFETGTEMKGHKLRSQAQAMRVHWFRYQTHVR